MKGNRGGADGALGWWDVPGVAPPAATPPRALSGDPADVGSGPAETDATRCEPAAGFEYQASADLSDSDEAATGQGFRANGAGAQWPGPVPQAASSPAEVDDPAGLAIAQLRAAVDALVALDPTALQGGRLVGVLAAVEEQSRRLPVVRQQLVTEIDARGVAGGLGFRSTAALLRTALRLGRAEAATWVRNAEHLTARRALTSGEALPPTLPVAAAAQCAGALSADHLRIIAATVHRLPAALCAEDRLRVERDLVAAAAQFDPRRLGIIAERILAYVDPDGTLAAHDEARHRRGVTIGLPGSDGLSRISGWLTPLAREAVLAVLEPLSAPNPLHPAHAAGAEEGAGSGRNADGRSSRLGPAEACAEADRDTAGHIGELGCAGDRAWPAAERANDSPDPPPGQTPTTAADMKPPSEGRLREPPVGTQLRDGRSAAQRTHDALAEACERLLATATLPSQAGLPATILVIAHLRDLQAGHGLASTAHGTTLPIGDVVRLAAKARIVPAVFDADGAPLWLGRTQRLATVAQRHALIARDLGCTIPGCDVPAWRCQVHHAPPWAPQEPDQPPGRTDIDAMTLICSYDHHRIDDWTATISRGRTWWTPPPWIDAEQRPRTNTYFKPLSTPVSELW